MRYKRNNLKPMKKIDSFTPKLMKPKKETIEFIKQFSKSVDVLKTKNKKILVSKN